MQRFRTGVVVGKFYPPHRGHKYLIDTAAARSDKVIVLVTDTPGLKIPVELRAAWLREIHPRADVLVIPDICRDDDSEAWARHTVAFLGFIPDAVFTSESYGAPWAGAMGCAHVPVDPERTTFPVSGTRVRNNPFAMWRFLEPPVRAYYARRICVLGAESTGTTTLARDLAAHYGTVWVPEYGRIYAEGKYGAPHPEWRSDEFIHIAEQQARMEDQLAREADRVLICDTDPLATSVWHERYIGALNAGLVAIARRRRYDMYVLTGDEIPFVQDGTRDGERIRHAMHRRFEKVLEASGVPHMTARGTREERLKAVTAAIDPLICRTRHENRNSTSRSRPMRSYSPCAAVA